MSIQITPGRWLGLRRTSDSSSVFTILAFDQRGTYRKMLPADTSYDRAVQIKQDIVGALSAQASAVLLDNEYGLLPALHMDRACGLLMSVEKSGYSGDSTYRKVEFDPTWDVVKIKRMGASAVKLLAYYHPASGELADSLDGVIREVADVCHAHDLPLFLEPMSYSLDAAVAKESEAFAATRPQVVKETARRLSKTGADVLKLEFPVDAAFDQNRDSWRAGCEAVSEASSMPWVLLSAGVDFDTFAEQTEIACRAGASGFLAGRAIWKEAVTLTDAGRADFLRETGVPRLQKLCQLAGAYARPWTQWYTPISAVSGWHKGY